MRGGFPPPCPYLLLSSNTLESITKNSFFQDHAVCIADQRTSVGRLLDSKLFLKIDSLEECRAKLAGSGSTYWYDPMLEEMIKTCKDGGSLEEMFAVAEKYHLKMIQDDPKNGDKYMETII